MIAGGVFSAFRELGQNGARGEAVPYVFCGAHRILCAWIANLLGDPVCSNPSRAKLRGEPPRVWFYVSGNMEELEVIVDAVAEKLDARLQSWKPETAAEARERIAELIDLADNQVLDLVRSRAAEQAVLDMIDEPPAG